jgi:hypothetical protein
VSGRIERRGLTLGLHHEFLLASLCDVKGTSFLGGNRPSFCLAGALVAEMQERERLVTVGPNEFALASGPMSTDALGLAEARLGEDKWSMKKAVSRVAWYWFSSVAPIRTAALEELVAAGILHKTQDTFLFIPWRMRYPERDPEVENALRQRLRTHVATATDGDAPSRDDLLLSLLRVGRLYDTIWSKDEIRALKPQLDERTKRAPLGKIVHTLIQEADAAAAAAAANYTCAASALWVFDGDPESDEHAADPPR